MHQRGMDSNGYILNTLAAFAFQKTRNFLEDEQLIQMMENVYDSYTNRAGSARISH